jgi:FkbM family methyltransferase
MAIVQKWNWYRKALYSLGPLSLARLQLQKRLGSRKRLSKLTSPILAHPVFARQGTSDFPAFQQIFVDREYRCLDAIKDPPKLIIDCGANVGYSSVWFLSKFPSCSVIAVEPDPDNFEVLKHNLLPYGGRCDAIQAAIWPNTKRLQIKKARAGHEWGHIVEVAKDAQFSVASVTIPFLIAKSGFGRISVLKIDIEGAEFELLKADTQWLDYVDNIVIELHGNECSKAFFDAVRPKNFVISTCGELTVCQTPLLA